MPNFRRLIKDEDDLEKFLENSDMLKVILFNEKPDAPQDFKAITSYYRNRIDFAEVSNETAEICEQYEVESFPTVILLKYDQETDEYKRIRYGGARRFESLRAFLNKHALKEKKRKWKSDFEETVDFNVTQLDSSEVESALFKSDKASSDRWVLLHLKMSDSPKHSKFE